MTTTDSPMLASIGRLKCRRRAGRSARASVIFMIEKLMSEKVSDMPTGDWSAEELKALSAVSSVVKSIAAATAVSTITGVRTSRRAIALLGINQDDYRGHMLNAMQSGRLRSVTRDT